jgi:Arc/MetJ-type ribon-helix-helix transcriptional regulator
VPQLNLNTTPEFERDLEALMKTRGLKSKSEAIRAAVHEARQAKDPPLKRDLSGLIGLVHRVPGPMLTDKSSAELLREIDDEMDEKLDRLAGKT